jgi:anti-sigma factor ChrR (cupin superfamily)
VTDLSAACVADRSPSAEEVELYALGRMSEEARNTLEAHLLACAHCRNEVANTDIYLRAMRSVLRQHAEEHQRRRLLSRRVRRRCPHLL